MATEAVTKTAAKTSEDYELEGGRARQVSMSTIRYIQ